MKVKKYVAETMIEAMKDIRSELGPEAVILSSKEISTGGFLGMFKSKKIEVIATLDPEPVQKMGASPEAPKVDHTKTISTTNTGENEKILNEINHLKRMLERQDTNKGKYIPVYAQMLDYLTDQEVQPSLAEEIVDSVNMHHETHDILPSTELVLRDTKREIEKRIFEASFHLNKQQEQQVIHFVGPTGVGKTTTLAKVAAKCMLRDHKKIAFITTDTYRIAAIEQLKTYAQILSVPVKVAYDQDDYKQALEAFASYDMIFVDTAGRNFRDETYVKELEDHIQVDMKVYLVLALTTKQKDIIDIYEQFSHLPIKELIFTKLDETKQFGSALNMALNHNMRIAYVTNGQGVPEDLLQPTASMLTEYVLGGYPNE